VISLSADACRIYRDENEGSAWAATLLTGNLTHLSLNSAGLMDAGAENLAVALTSVSCNLTSLSVRGNDIGLWGAQAFARALASPACPLKTLDLGANGLGGRAGCCGSHGRSGFWHVSSRHTRHVWHRTIGRISRNDSKSNGLASILSFEYRSLAIRDAKDTGGETMQFF